jgi:hypothetical protein
MASDVSVLDELLDDQKPGRRDETIEERCFYAALICLEGHYTSSPPMGPLTRARVTKMVSRTLEKTHAFREVRLVNPQSTSLLHDL